MKGFVRTAALLVGAAFFVSATGAQPLSLVLPTDNDALLRGDGPAFYMYTYRNFEGVRSQPWEGGQYGFSRDQQRTPVGVVFTRFHEGLDIAPVRRDGRGEPLDEVRAVDEGRVVYVSTNPRESAYGIYVVIEHQWQGSPYYTLYGHLMNAGVRAGQQVRQGTRIGRLGYTGTGINRTRAHLHFEINLYLSDRFEAWLEGAHPRSRNPHGRFHGLNLVGLDPAALYLAFAENPDVLIGEVVQREAPAWRVMVPGGYVPELVQRYPWLAGDALPATPPAAWIVSLTGSGLPLRFEGVEQEVARPVVVHVSDRVREGHESTNKLLSRSGEAFVLTEKGTQHLRLLTLSLPSVGPAPRAW